MIKKSAFTLVEILIVIVIVAMLFVVMMRSYVVMTSISVRVQQEKTMVENMVWIMQIFNNLADSYVIDFDEYGSWLIDRNGMSDKLFLSGLDDKIVIYASGDLIMEKNGDTIVLTDGSNIKVENLQFKIIPYGNVDVYIENCKYDYKAYCIYNPWFWMMWDMVSNRWSESWEQNVRIPLQLFFNMNTR